MPALKVPPDVVIAAEDGERKTHIEVCVRLRPLVIANESSSSFFDKIQRRKAQIPRHANSKTPTKIPSPSDSKRTEDTRPTEQNPIYAWDCVGDDTVRQNPATDIVQGRTHAYTVDRVYGPETSTKLLYDASVMDLVHAAMDGYHTSVLAYGQTSTGKTHTMTGTASQPGLIPLCIKECFDYLTRQDQPREYLLRVSYLEVYKEHIRDLLATSAAAPPIRLFDSADGLVIKGLKEEVVTSPQQVFEILAQGEARRQVGATHLNQHSSRSHVMVRLWIESRAVNGKGALRSNSSPSLASSSASSMSSDTRPVRVSSLSLVDLAGSESVKLSGSVDRSQEGHFINKSLMTLGQVVYALSEESVGGTKKHVPYRDSKLTRLLQPSLSGNAQVVLICCISPLVTHIEESHNTFKFAIRAKKIPQRATIQENTDEKTLLQSYRQEIEDLKHQLREARAQQERLSNVSIRNYNNEDETETEDEIHALVQAIQSMEKLIIKNKAPLNPEDLLDSSEVDEGEEESLLQFASKDSTTQPAPTNQGYATPSKEVNKDLPTELARIQGLLGSVLKKRAAKTPNKSEQELKSLRAQLEQQAVTSSLRQADSSFLQHQLEEKDDLLREVSKILEQFEFRQAQLEQENELLRKELAVLKSSTK